MKIFTLSIFLISFSFYQVFSQCCAAGNPSYMNNGISSTQSDNLNIMFSYMYSYSDQYYQGSSLSDYRYIDNSYFNFASLKAIYNLTDELSFNSNLGFFINKSQNFDFGGGETYSRKAFGLGDAGFGVSYLLFNQLDNFLNIQPSLNITLPIGEFDQKDGAVVLPIDIQPSSGSYRYNIGISFSKYFEELDLFLFSNNAFEYSQRIETERTHYKYGDLYNISVGGLYRINEIISTGLEIRNQIRSKSEDKEKLLIASTGGNVLFISPSFALNILDAFPINFQFDYPIYKNMNGIQLTNNYASTLNVSYNFNFSEEQNFKPLELDSNHQRKQFIVKGSCEMCKERIEGIAGEFKNVINAEWDSELQLLFITYNIEPDFDSILKEIAKAGHDAENYIADERNYNALPSCCKYK